jgi:[citrate (pro-3S)-lyase] ligase
MKQQSPMTNQLIETLHETTEFHTYMKLLKKLSKTTAIAVVSNDTPVGLDFKESDSALIKDLGFTIDIFDAFRYCYAGFLYCGELLFEGLDKKPIDETLDLGGVSVRLKSCAYDSLGHGAGFAVDSKFIDINMRGLAFFVLSVPDLELIEAVNFDTFFEDLPFRRLFPRVQYMRLFGEAHPDVSVIGFGLPKFDSIPPESYTENEKYITYNLIRRKELIEKDSLLAKYFPDSGDRRTVVEPPPSYRDIFGVRKFYDYNTKYVNCEGGIRKTAYTPNTFKRAVYIVGDCLIFGHGASDSGTVASFLQKELNEKCPEEGFAVFNYGYYLCEEDKVVDEEQYIINFLPVKPGDIVLAPQYSEKFPYIKFPNPKRPYIYGDIFIDRTHPSEAGNHLIADVIFDGLKAGNFYPKAKPALTAVRKDELHMKPEEAAQLKAYTDLLDEFAAALKITNADPIGAIVMNCNPFTNGHRYLIETAAAKVKYLFVFAVQEDRSEFPFEERYELMQAATEDIENVYVLPSGQFIISSFTFEEYFNKKSLNTMAVNPSNDIRLFGGQIAPHLNIKTRFAGEEPLDPVTRQYNRQMEAILPQYGVSFEEIPRKEIDGEVISASRVRELLKTRDFEAIARLVPEVTLEYLKEKYS